MRLPLLLAACLLSSTVFAQAPQGAEPAKQERREKMKAAHQKARSACESKQGQEHRDCMQKVMCAQSKDPARCEAHLKERSAAFNKAYDVCKGKATGDEFQACMQSQRPRGKK